MTVRTTAFSSSSRCWPRGGDVGRLRGRVRQLGGVGASFFWGSTPSNAPSYVPRKSIWGLVVKRMAGTPWPSGAFQWTDTSYNIQRSSWIADPSSKCTSLVSSSSNTSPLSARLAGSRTVSPGTPQHRAAPSSQGQARVGRGLVGPWSGGGRPRPDPHDRRISPGQRPQITAGQGFGRRTHSRRRDERTTATMWLGCGSGHTVTALDPTSDPTGAQAGTGFEEAVAEFLGYLRARNYAAGSVTAYGHALGLLRRFLAERGITSPGDVSAEVLESYRHHLGRQMTRQGRPLSVATQSHRLQAARVFFRWAFRHPPHTA